MADIADIAQDYIPDFNVVAQEEISNKLEEQAKLPSLETCLDCWDPIPVKRQMLGGIKYCAECQVFHDK